MKSGFVMLAGRSNVGKSTLLNALVGSKVSIVTPKPQTTRRPIRGVLHDPRGQIVFVDTPGVFLGKKDPVSQKLNQFVQESLEGVDAIVYVVDPTRAAGPEEENIQKRLRETSIPRIIVINKSDLPVAARPISGAYHELQLGQKSVLEVSAKTGQNLTKLVDFLFDLLQEGESWYPDQQLTDIGHKEWLEELVREKVFLSLEQELPYSVNVTIESIEERSDGSRYIQATVWTTDERYKGMIVGAKGSKIKEIGSKTREELEEVLQTKIFLDLHVKVDPKWPERF